MNSTSQDATMLITKLENKIANAAIKHKEEVNITISRIVKLLHEAIDKWDGFGNFRVEYTVITALRLDVLEALRKMIGVAFTVWSDQGCIIIMSKKSGIEVEDERSQLNSSK